MPIIAARRTFEQDAQRLREAVIRVGLTHEASPDIFIAALADVIGTMAATLERLDGLTLDQREDSLIARIRATYRRVREDIARA